MEFTLTYRGKLLGASRSNTRADEKQRLREHFGRQIERIWKDDIRFNDIDPTSLQEPISTAFDPFDVARPIQNWRGFFFRLELKGYTFVPLLTAPVEADCWLVIRLLRPQRPGGIVYTGGDLDNTLKTIFDALRMPREAQEVLDPPAGVTRGLVYCLLADDRLVTRLVIDSKRLLLPAEELEPGYVKTQNNGKTPRPPRRGGRPPPLFETPPQPRGEVGRFGPENGCPNGCPRFSSRSPTMRTRKFSNEFSSPDGIRTHDLFLEREAP